MTGFLIRYDRHTGELEATEFVGEHAREEALAARVDAEVARTDADLEVVLTADSLDEVMRTHGRYFLTPAELVRAALGADPGARSPRGVGSRTPPARAAAPAATNAIGTDTDGPPDQERVVVIPRHPAGHELC